MSELARPETPIPSARPQRRLAAAGLVVFIVGSLLAVAWWIGRFGT